MSWTRWRWEATAQADDLFIVNGDAIKYHKLKTQCGAVGVLW